MGLFSKKSKVFQMALKNNDTNRVDLLTLRDDHLEIGILAQRGFKTESTRTLPYNRINDVVLTMDIKTIEKSKSPIGRAVAGGLLFGGVGAVVGAVSGTAKKEIKKNEFFFLISYISKDGEEKILNYSTAGETYNYSSCEKFSSELKNRCNILESGEL